MSTPASSLVDERVRARITTDGVRETLFVEAGAGTGKTSTLVARIVRLVLHEDVPLAELAAITFTEAAAAELRDRVRQALVEQVAGGDAVLAARARNALDEFDVAAITTLHGFALRILGEHPIDVGIPPRVEVLDEVQSLLAFEERWQRAVLQWQDDPAFEAHVVRLWSCGVELRRRVGPSLQRIAAVFDDNWDRLDDLPAVPVPALRRLDRRPLVEAIDRALACRSSCTDPADKLLARIDEREPQLRALLAADPADDDRLLTLLQAHAPLDHGGKGSRKNWPDIAATHATLHAVDAEVAALRQAAADDILTIWTGILRDLTLEAAHARRDAGQLEFHDLLVLARRLLRTSRPARHALHQRYRRLLLDEFQDTDPIQIELALRIAAPPDDQPDDWRDIVPPPGRLFVVGDPKQSIYRFRRADISLFHQARHRFGAGAAVSLVQNFRTVEPIVAWVNAVFAALMPDETPSRPQYRPIVATRSPSAPGAHLVRVFGTEHADAPAAAALRARETDDVAAIVEAIRRDPDHHLVAERRNGADVWRPARCADITILIPSRTSLPMLEAALAARDLPYRVDTSTLVFDSPEVRDLLTVLLSVDDPADSLATVAALRSELFACPDTELFDWVQAGGSWDHRLAGAPAAADARAAAPDVAAALAQLAVWHEAARWCEPATLLERIVRERDVFALALSVRRPRDAWRRVRFLIDQARHFAEVQGGPVREFVRWAELQRNEGSRVPEPLLPELDDDAVRIMTFHGAKGLEFPIVVLSGLTTRPNPPSSGPQVRWDTDGVPQISIGKSAATDRFDVLNEFESEMDADEKLRLLYVGATRARDHLYVSTHRLAKDAGSTDATFAVRVHRASSEHAPDLTKTWVPSDTPAAPAAAVVAVGTAVDDGVTAGDVADRAADAAADFAAWCAARVGLLAGDAGARTVWSATAVADALAPPYEPVARPVAPPFDTEAVDAPDALRWVGGTALGRAVHAVLEHVDPADASGQAALVARMAAAEGVDARVVATAVTQVLAAPTVQAALAASRHWRELEIDIPVGPAIIHGVIDLLAELDGELVLVDYKTDRVAPAALDARVATYAPQLAAYALAIESHTGRRVARAVLVFVGPEGAVEREVPDLPGVGARVRDLLENPTRGARPETPGGRSPEG